ncbi:hypothetical protein B0H19DRAFT_1366721 [Mycena capillaripes]|nr:hypothetical protein B0H19DRAFT_1366721 [Mycena capillaripes]
MIMSRRVSVPPCIPLSLPPSSLLLPLHFSPPHILPRHPIPITSLTPNFLFAISRIYHVFTFTSPSRATILLSSQPSLSIRRRCWSGLAFIASCRVCIPQRHPFSYRPCYPPYDVGVVMSCIYAHLSSLSSLPPILLSYLSLADPPSPQTHRRPSPPAPRRSSSSPTRRPPSPPSDHARSASV